MRPIASRVVRSDGIACRRHQDWPRGQLWSKSPHHLISGRLTRSLHPYPACTGQSARPGGMEPIFLTASKPWGAYGPHPSCFVASNAGHYASNSELTLDDRSFRHQPLRHIPPQGDHQLAGQSYDHCAADAPLAGADALLEPAGQIALGLVPQPQPGQLNRGAARAWGCRIAEGLDRG
jgi:hypothetical protein